MTPCKFTFDDGKVWEGFAEGTTWNGFDNVSVTRSTAAAIDAWFGNDGSENAVIGDMVADENGLISLANGYATQIVEP